MKIFKLIGSIIVILLFTWLMFWLGSEQGHNAAMIEKGHFEPRIDTTWIWVPNK